MCYTIISSSLGLLIDIIGIVLDSGSHFEEKSAHFFIWKDSIWTSMFGIKSFHFPGSKLTSKFFKSLDKPFVVNHSFILHIKVSEICFRPGTLIFLNVCFLSDFFEDGDFHLSESVDSNFIVHKSVTMNENIHKILLPLAWNTCVEIEIVLLEFVIVDMFLICWSFSDGADKLFVNDFRLFDPAAIVRVIFRVKLFDQSGKFDYFLSMRKFFKTMIDGGKSFRWEVISNIVDEVDIGDSQPFFIELIFDDVDLLSGKEDSERV